MTPHRAVVAGAFAAAIVLALAGPATAVEPTSEGVVIRSVDTSDYPSISVTVSVPESVAAEQIEASENGKPMNVQSVRSLAETGEGFDVVLAIDTSDSVEGAPLAAAVQAAQSFVEGLPAGVPVAVVTFDDRARVLQPFSEDHVQTLDSLEGLGETQAHTTLFDAVFVASGIFESEAQHNVVLLTDGKDVGSRHTLEQAVARAKTRNATLFTIGLGRAADADVLQSLANGSDGAYTPAAQANLQSIYEDLAGTLTNQYVLTYSSTAPQGAQVTVGVSAPGGSDRSFVLMPTLPRAAEPVSNGWDLSLTGTLGLAVVLGLSFLTVLVLGWLLVSAVAASRRDRDLARRMGAAKAADGPTPRQAPSEGPASWIPQSVTQAGESIARATGFLGALERRLERASWPMAPGEYVAVTAIAAVAGAIVGLLLNNVLLALGLVVLAGVTPFVFLSRSESRRIERLVEQLPDVLMILASTMRAGHSFLQALDTASKEIGDPSAPEFARLVGEIRLGRPPEEALSALAERVGTEEFRWAMMAVNVQREVGGNLAEILDTLAETVREREAVRRQVRVLSAEGRLSMKVLIGVPPLLFLYFAVFRTEYIRLLWTTAAGGIMLGVAFVLMCVAVVVARKIVRIDV